MSEYSELFSQKLIWTDVNETSRNNLFKKVSKYLHDNGFVKESYFEVLNKREDEFPTGIASQFLPIALPHANPENVNKPFIAVIKNKKPVPMKQMGTNEDLEVNYFFFLGIVQETQDLQVKLLQRFMQLLNDQEFVSNFIELNNSKDVFDYLRQTF